VLGITSVEFLRGQHALAVVDSPLEERRGSAASTGGSTAATTVSIGNFSFTPATTPVPAGSTVTWTNADDVPHRIASSDGAFASSPALDTGDQYAFRFTRAGRYEYFCSLHPKMMGVIIVG
jgi:plastocyanin